MSDLLTKDRKNIWHPFSPLKGLPDPKIISHAKDCTLYIEDGSTLIDAISSWWVNPLGHANKAIADAVYKQMLTVEHVIFAGFTHKPAIDLSERILNIAGSDFKKVFFSDNGSTSVEVALKMAVQKLHNLGVKRNKIVSFKDAYHGDTFGAMAVGQKGSFFTAFEEMVFEPIQIPEPNPANWEGYLQRFESILQTEKPAAFIFEPLIMGAGGMKMYEPEHLDAMIALAQKHDVTCIADEVMTGFGRTGKMLASEYLENKPDIICLSKCLTGGFMPLSLTVVNQRIVDAFDSPDADKAFYHGHSYTGNPMACAAANAALEQLCTQETQANWSRIHEAHLAFSKELKTFDRVKNIRLRGTILAFDVSDSSEGYFSSVKKQLQEQFLASGVLLRPLGNVVYVMPPYVITDEELNKTYQAIIKGLESL